MLQDAMGICVSDDLIDQATKCESVLSCLSGNLEGSCKMRKYVAGEVLLVENGKGEAYAYLRSLRYSHMCLCPVRKEIYRRYEV